MMEVPLSRGMVALIDDADWPLVSKWKWHARRDHDRAYYAECTTPKHTALEMHRVLIGALAGQEVDHVNGNSLDNRRSNLRLATRDQNMFNRPKMKTNTSGFKGVIATKSGKWGAQIKAHKRYHWLGLFSTAIAAAHAYDRAAVQLHGEFACINFPKPVQLALFPVKEIA